MVVTTTHFAKQKAPCGRTADGDHHVEGDDDGFACDDFECAPRLPRDPACVPRRNYFAFGRYDMTAKC